MFNPSTGLWTWKDGSSTGSQAGVYGTMGMPAAGNTPGARASASSWTDSSGNLWLFGGDDNVGDLNDLWEYQVSASTTPQAATPTFSVASGTYSSPQTVTIFDATPGATIYYTTDGTTPTTSSKQYTVPLTVSSTETVEAIATASGYTTSAVATATYTITALLPVAGVAPGSLSFGTQNIGTNSLPQAVMLSNTGGGALVISSITATGDFSQTNNCGSSVAAGGSCTINVTFTPTAVGSRNGTLTTTDNNGGVTGSTQTVSLTGTGIAPLALVSPTALTFGSQLVGTASASQPVKLGNTGNVALTVTSIAISPNFGQTNNCGGSVAASGSCTFSVTFAPAATGTLTGTLTITDDNNEVGGSTQTVSLTGMGTAVSLSPASLSFGAQLMGSGSLKTVTLTNLGSTPLSISSLTVVSIAPLTPLGTKAEDFTIQSGSCVAGGSVAGLGSCTINVAFKPTAAGVRSATLVIGDSDPGSPQTVRLRGTGTAVWLSALSINFGPQRVHTSSVPRIVTLTNLGSTPLRIESLALSSTDGGDFAIQSGSTCAAGSTVAGEGMCTINLAFKPSAAGPRSATLAISDSDPGSPQTVRLSGAGM
jgi:hypothetical protein